MLLSGYFFAEVIHVVNSWFSLTTSSSCQALNITLDISQVCMVHTMWFSKECETRKSNKWERKKLKKRPKTSLVIQVLKKARKKTKDEHWNSKQLGLGFLKTANHQYCVMVDIFLFSCTPCSLSTIFVGQNLGFWGCVHTCSPLLNARGWICIWAALIPYHLKVSVTSPKLQSYQSGWGYIFIFLPGKSTNKVVVNLEALVKIGLDLFKPWQKV